MNLHFCIWSFWVWIFGDVAFVFGNVEIKAVGRTSTHGIVSVPPDEKLRICCTMFDRENDLFGHNQLSILPSNLADSATTISRNRTSVTIEMVMTKNNSFVCMRNHKSLAQLDVFLQIGPAKLKPGDFHCRSYHRSYTRCRLEPKPFGLHYSRSVTFKRSESDFDTCVFDDNEPGMCRIDYDLLVESVDFVINLSNEYGNISDSFHYNHFLFEVQRPVINLTAKVTELGVHLQWTPDYFHPYGLSYIVRCNSTYEKSSKPKVVHSKSFMDLTDLRYGNTNYSCEVQSQVINASRNDPYLLSNKTWVQFTTLKRVPEFPPLTTIGAFEIISNQVTVYWELLSQQFSHGPGLKYHITVKRKNKLILNKTTNGTQCLCVLGTIDTSDKWMVYISSVNDVGHSLARSSLSVHVPVETCGKPEHVRKVFNKATNVYSLSWSAPPMDVYVSNYTVFWCKQDSESENNCVADTFDFTFVGSSVRNYTARRNMNFAVSANCDHISSGMVWTRCTSTKGHSPGRLHLSSRNNTVLWTPDCIDEALLGGVEITAIKCLNGTCEQDKFQIHNPNQRSHQFSTSFDSMNITVKGISIEDGSISRDETQIYVNNMKTLTIESPYSLAWYILFPCMLLVILATMIVIRCMRKVKRFKITPVLPPGLFPANIPRIDSLNSDKHISGSESLSKKSTDFSELSESLLEELVIEGFEQIYVDEGMFTASESQAEETNVIASQPIDFKDFEYRSFTELCNSLNDQTTLMKNISYIKQWNKPSVIGNQNICSSAPALPPHLTVNGYVQLPLLMPSVNLMSTSSVQPKTNTGYITMGTAVDPTYLFPVGPRSRLDGNEAHFGQLSSGYVTQQELSALTSQPHDE